MLVVGFLLLLQFGLLAFGAAQQAMFNLPAQDEDSMHRPAIGTQGSMSDAFRSILEGPSTGQNGTWLDTKILGCVDNQNITMHVGNLSVVYSQGRIRAVNDSAPTVWTLSSSRHPQTGDLGWEISHRTPFGAKVFWQSRDSMTVEASTRYWSVMNIAYTRGNLLSPQVVLGYNDRYVWFDEQGYAQLDEMYYQPISTRVVRPVGWTNAAEKEGCISTQINRLLEKIGEGDGNSVHAEDFWKKVKDG